MKKILSLLYFLCCCLFLFGCNSVESISASSGISSGGSLSSENISSEQFQIQKYESPEEFAESTGLKMYMKQSEYSSDTEYVSAYVENPTEFEAGMGAEWRIERYYSEQGFKPIAFKEDFDGFSLTWYEILPNKTASNSANLSGLAEKLSPGRYRLVFTSVVLDGVASGCLAAEFIIK